MLYFRRFRAAILTCLFLLTAAPGLYAGENPAPPVPSPSGSVFRLWDWLVERVRPGGFEAALGFLGHDVDPDGGGNLLGHDIDPDGAHGDLGHDIDPNG